MRPRRSYDRPLFALGVVAFLVAISQSGIIPGDQFKLKTQNEKPAPPKLPEFIPEAKVGETVRIFFGVGGPNYTSSFHLIGEIFDKVYNLGGVLSEPLRGVQTVTVPAGGAVITEFKLDVPGSFTLVDHALSRMERGLVGMLHVEGPSNPEIFDGKTEPGSGH